MRNYLSIFYRIWLAGAVESCFKSIEYRWVMFLAMFSMIVVGLLKNNGPSYVMAAFGFIFMFGIPLLWWMKDYLSSKD